MLLRYVSAKNPESITAFMSQMRGIRFTIVSGPVPHKGRWYLWYSADTGMKLNNVDLED